MLRVSISARVNKYNIDANQELLAIGKYIYLCVYRGGQHLYYMYTFLITS